MDREGQLKGEIFKEIVAGGGRFMRHDDRTVEGARKVLGEIIPLPPKAVRIQKEIREEGKSLHETDAGSVLREEVDRIIAKHKAEMDAIRAEMQAAKGNDVEALRKDRDELQRELKRWEEEKSRIQDTRKGRDKGPLAFGLPGTGWISRLGFY